MNLVEAVKNDYEHFNKKIMLLEWKFKCLCLLREGKVEELRQELNEAKTLPGFPQSFFQTQPNEETEFLSLSNLIYSKIDERMDELVMQQDDLAKKDAEKHMFLLNRVIHQEEELAKEEKSSAQMKSILTRANLKF